MASQMRRVEIFFVSPEFEEERLMIDSGAEEGDVVNKGRQSIGEHLAGSLNAMTKPNVRATGCGVYRPTICGHRIDVVQQQRVRRKIVQFQAKIDQDRDGPERAKHASRTKRIAHALLYAVSLRYFDVRLVRLQAALLKSGDHIVGVPDGGFAIRRRFDLAGELSPVGD